MKGFPPVLYLTINQSIQSDVREMILTLCGLPLHKLTKETRAEVRRVARLDIISPPLAHNEQLPLVEQLHHQQQGVAGIVPIARNKIVPVQSPKVLISPVEQFQITKF